MKELKYLVLDSTVEVVKTSSKVLPWQACCKYTVYRDGDSGELKKAVAYGTTKNDAMISAVSSAYREVIWAIRRNKESK